MTMTLFVYGSSHTRVRGFREKSATRGDRILVRWVEEGARRTKTWPYSRENIARARRFAEQLASLREGDPPGPITLEELWQAYETAEFPHLRPTTQASMRNRWRLFLTLVSKTRPAESLTVRDLELVRTLSTSESEQAKITSVVRQVLRWGGGGGGGKLLEYPFPYYEFKRRKAPPASPPEYTADEVHRLLNAFPKASQWRQRGITTLLAHQGVRVNAALHLRWEDVDFEQGRLTWRANYDKLKREWQQPMRARTRAALEEARQHATGPWVFPGNTPEAPFTRVGYDRALRAAEIRAGVPKRPGRAAHGFRRAVAGDMYQATGNLRTALEFIGDRDLGVAHSYILQRMPRLEEAVAKLDRVEREPPLSEVRQVEA